MSTAADVVICGAGIAGLAAAHELAVKASARRIVIVSDDPPMSLTSDKSTECYRNFWPGPDGAMVALMNRSIDLLTEIALATDNAIRMNRRGYVYATSDPARIASLGESAALAEKQGAGPLRETGYVPNDPGAAVTPPGSAREEATGADLITDPALIQAHFPFLAPGTAAVLHVRRAGWFSGHELGMLLLECGAGRGSGAPVGTCRRHRARCARSRGGALGEWRSHCHPPLRSGRRSLATPCGSGAASGRPAGLLRAPCQARLS